MDSLNHLVPFPGIAALAVGSIAVAAVAAAQRKSIGGWIAFGVSMVCAAGGVFIAWHMKTLVAQPSGNTATALATYLGVAGAILLVLGALGRAMYLAGWKTSWFAWAAAVVYAEHVGGYLPEVWEVWSRLSDVHVPMLFAATFLALMAASPCYPEDARMT